VRPWEPTIRPASSLFALLLAAAPSARGAEPESAWTAYCTQRADWLVELARWPDKCLRRQDTAHTLFAGCIDWHSSVHAHWALLRAAHALGDSTIAAVVGERLVEPGLTAEASYLAGHPDFELPYGRAWFLRLALEQEADTGSTVLQPMADPVAASLRQRYTEQAPDPHTAEYRNASWALVQLYAWAKHRGDAQTMAWVTEQVSTRFSAASPDITPAQDLADRPEFFSRWGNQALLLQTVLGSEAPRAWLAGQAAPDTALVPVSDPQTAHHLGMNASRAWGMWAAYEATGDPRWREAYATQLQAAMASHTINRDHYGTYGHWVPQFDIYAVTAPMGGPRDCPAKPPPPAR